MKTFIIFLLISTAVFAGEVKNSKIGIENEKSNQRGSDKIVGYTAGWTAKLAEWYKENVVIPQEEAEAMGLNPSACFSIKNEVAKSTCIASINAGIKQDPAICSRISDADSRYDCIASVTNLESNCYMIKDGESQIACRANIQQNSGLCHSIRNSDNRWGCLAGVMHEKSYCFSIKSDDGRWGCLAGFPP